MFSVLPEVKSAPFHWILCLPHRNFWISFGLGSPDLITGHGFWEFKLFHIDTTFQIRLGVVLASITVVIGIAIIGDSH